MKTETIQKGNRLVNKINSCEFEINQIKDRIVEYKKWYDAGQHDMSKLFKIIVHSQGGFINHELDFEFIDPLYLMQGYLDNAKKALELYQKDLKDLKDE